MELKINELLELIREQVELFEDVGAPPPKTTQLELDDWIPKIQISSEWGSADNKSREQIDKFARRVPEKQVNFDLSHPAGIYERKLQGLIDLVKGPEKTSEAGLGSVFATIVLLDIMHAIIANIESNAAGYLFESFCAALAGGAQRGGTRELTDFESSDGIQYSLKLTKEGLVKGSFSNLYEEFGVGRKVESPNAEGFNKNYFIRYIVFNKGGEGGGLEVFAFDLDNESFPALMNAKFESEAVRSNWQGKYVRSQPQENPETQALFTQDGKYFKEGVTFEDIMKARVFRGSPNLGLTRDNIMKVADKMPNKAAIIAQLPNIEEIKDAARKAAEQFKDLLIPTYKSMKDLTDNLNTYFLGVGGDEADRRDSSAASIEAERIVTKELPENVVKAVVRRDTSSPIRGALEE